MTTVSQLHSRTLEMTHPVCQKPLDPWPFVVPPTKLVFSQKPSADGGSPACYVKKLSLCSARRLPLHIRNVLCEQTTYSLPRDPHSFLLISFGGFVLFFPYTEINSCQKKKMKLTQIMLSFPTFCKTFQKLEPRQKHPE